VPVLLSVCPAAIAMTPAPAAKVPIVPVFVLVPAIRNAEAGRYREGAGVRHAAHINEIATDPNDAGAGSGERPAADRRPPYQR
jgi:hypothetical protein